MLCVHNKKDTINFVELCNKKERKNNSFQKNRNDGERDGKSKRASERNAKNSSRLVIEFV